MVRSQLIIKKVLARQLVDNPSAVNVSPKTPDTPAANGVAKKRRSYAVTIAIPNGSQLVPKDLKINAGTPLQACYGKKWAPMTALGQNSDGTLNVHWDKYSDSWDCSMVRSQLIIKNTLVNKILAAARSAKAPKMRTWTDVTGKFEIKAKLVSSSKTQVTLLKKDGSEITLPIADLGKADREYLSQ